MTIGYFTLNFIIIPILVSTVNAERKEWIINKTSCNRNDILTRAVRGNVSAAIIATCDNFDDYSCEVQYIFADQPDKKINIHNGSPTNYSGILTMYNIDVVVFYAYMKAIHVTPRIILNITIIPPSENEFELTLKTQNLCWGTLATIKFVGCKNHTEFHVRLHESRIARYLDEGTIVCTKSEKGRAVFSNNSEAIHTQCLDDATWRYANNITCLYPIAGALRIDGKPYMKAVELKFNQSDNASNEAFVQCFRKDGSQNTSIPTVILYETTTEKNINNSIINFHPNMNGENVSCYFEDRYTRLFEPHLSTSLLNISFGPYPPHEFDSLCYFKNGSIKFHSNPASTESMLSLWKGENEKIPTTISECCEMNYGVVGQLITPSMSITGTGFRLRRNYSGKIEHYSVTPCQSVITTTKVIRTTFKTNFDSTSTENVQDTKPGGSTMVVMLCIGSVLLLITLSAISLFYWRRQNQGKPMTGNDKSTLDNEVGLQRNYPAAVYEEVNAVPTEPVSSHEYTDVVPVSTPYDSTLENTLLTETHGYQTATFSTNQSPYEYVSNS